MCVVFLCVQTMGWLPAATRAVSVCSVFVCPNNGMGASAWDFNGHMRTDADACDFTLGLRGHRKRVCTRS